MKNFFQFIRKALLSIIAVGICIYIYISGRPFPTELHLYMSLLSILGFSVLVILVAYVHFFVQKK